MSYALTNKGTVYAWGDNKEGCLALEHENPRVSKPEPMMRTKDTIVKRLAVRECGGSAGQNKGKTVIAFVELADELKPEEMIGGYKAPLGSPSGNTQADAHMVLHDYEEEIFKGVDLMRKVTDNVQDWWAHVLNVRHGSPYEDNPTQVDQTTDVNAQSDNCTAMELDKFVSLDILEKASYELDMLIQSAKNQLTICKSNFPKGTKNVKFILTLFMDDCKLRKEKIRRTVSARQLTEHKKGVVKAPQVTLTDTRSGNDVQRLYHADQQLTRTLQRVRNLKTYDVFTRALQDSIIECIECKLQVHATQAECLKARQGEPSDPILPALRIIKERWVALKQFSIYNLFQECNLRGQGVNFGSDDEMLAFLVQSSDQKIDQIIQNSRDKMISQDLLVPSMCYDLLVENAELRKMCNTYQLKVLLMRQGKDRSGAEVNGTLAITS
jgi:hypothetical protein